MHQSLCSTGSRWLQSTLETLTDAVVVLVVGKGEADSEHSGAIVYRNNVARAVLHKYKHVSIKDWEFQDGQDWQSICDQLLVVPTSSVSSPYNSSQGEKASTHKSVCVTAQIPSTEASNDEPKKTLIRLHPVIHCNCCEQNYSVAYLSITGNDDHSGEEDSHMNLQSHRCLQATVNASFDAMFTIDHSGTILLTNQAAVRLFGYDSVDDFFGQNVSMICGRDHASQHDEYLRRYLTTGVAHIMGRQRRVLAARRDGTEFPIELGIVELPSDPSSSERYFSAYIRDLTELEAQQVMASEKSIRTQTLINASFDPMVEIDQRGVILLTNKAMVNLFGYSKEELIGSNISKICGGEHGAHHDAYIQRYLETGKSSIIGRKRDTVARRKDGSDFPIELAVQQVKLDNGEWIFCGFIRDLTTHKLMQQHLVRQERLIQNQFFQGGTSGSGEAGSADNGTTSARPRRPKRSPVHGDHSNAA